MIVVVYVSRRIITMTTVVMEFQFDGWHQKCCPIQTMRFFLRRLQGILICGMILHAMVSCRQHFRNVVFRGLNEFQLYSICFAHLAVSLQ